jgi:hypothetical protein
MQKKERDIHNHNNNAVTCKKNLLLSILWAHTHHHQWTNKNILFSQFVGGTLVDVRAERKNDSNQQVCLECLSMGNR